MQPTVNHAAYDQITQGAAGAVIAEHAGNNSFARLLQPLAGPLALHGMKNLGEHLNPLPTAWSL
jgi:hypothetical protein